MEAANFLLLAAGRSRRMGRSKALLPHGAGTWLEAQVVALRAQGLSHGCLVVGEAAPYRTLAESLDLELRVNPDPESGPFASLHLGLEGCLGAVFVSPIDVPLTHRLGRLWEALGEAEAAQPAYQGRPGHPVLLSVGLVARLRALDPRDPAARLDHLLQGARTVRVELDDPRILLNLNTPEAWAAFTCSN